MIFYISTTMLIDHCITTFIISFLKAFRIMILNDFVNVYLLKCSCLTTNPDVKAKFRACFVQFYLDTIITS